MARNVGSPPDLRALRLLATLHDARVSSFNFSYAERQLEITFDYSDLKQANGIETELRALITLRWNGVSKAQFQLQDNAVYGISLGQTQEGFKTEFTNYQYGLDGTIDSQSIEVLSVERVDASMDDAPDSVSISIS